MVTKGSWITGLKWAMPFAVAVGIAACQPSGIASPPTPPPPPPIEQQPSSGVSPFIVVDQFGYLPDAAKVAVLRDPEEGFDAKLQYKPGATLEVRRANDNVKVLEGAPKSWRNGEVQTTSGDRGWWFDFSSLTAPGSYYVFDAQNNARSVTFDVRADIYKDVLKAAVRMYYYQRIGTPKLAQHAGAEYADDASFLQDAKARSVTDKNNAATERDLSGGWMDAGDYNKYTTFATVVIHQLLAAYTANPGAFTDDFNIPESGNGLSDLVDEIKYELEFLKKMQNPDGGTIIKIGSITYNAPSPPSRDTQARYYGPVCSSSTIAVAGMFAHAALVLKNLPGQQTYADDLRARAVKAWAWFNANPKSSSCDTQEIKSGDADWSLDKQTAAAVVSSVYLYALTGESRFNEVVKADYTKTRPFSESTLWSAYDAEEGDALLYYAQLPNADAAVKKDILDSKTAQGSNSGMYRFRDDDLYRAFVWPGTFHWGSNAPRANIGNTNLDMLRYNLDSANANAYRQRALEILHYFHGVNPLGLMYVSNMRAAGSENSADEFYHSWFADGTKWDRVTPTTPGPPPGYVVGGPNARYTGSFAPPKGEPAQKSYLSSNNFGPADNYTSNIWEISEPGIYYQSAYVKLVSAFVR
jgi:endoglucanase